MRRSRRTFNVGRVLVLNNPPTRFRQPSLGALRKRLNGFSVLLPSMVNISQLKCSVRVPLPRRLLQERNSLFHVFRI